eukprot:scaffold5519_cov269-Prasinococcus_capsulatus_cf.AAC.1
MGASAAGLDACRCWLLPAVGAELREGAKGGVRSAAGGAAGFGTNAFRMSPALTEAQRREVAWASFALLRNTNARALLLLHRGALVALRGELRLDAADAPWPELEERAAAAAAASSGEGEGSNDDDDDDDDEALLYVKERAAAAPEVQARVPFLPQATASAALVRLGGGASAGAGPSVLVLLSPERRAFSPSELAWARSCALKLRAALG